MLEFYTEFPLLRWRSVVCPVQPINVNFTVYVTDDISYLFCLPDLRCFYSEWY